MDDKKIWLKISGSITYYFKYYNINLSNEELWIDYMDSVLPDIEGNGVHTYLDKQTLERVIVDDLMMGKTKVVFIERLERRRINEKSVKKKKILGQIIEFSKYKG